EERNERLSGKKQPSSHGNEPAELKRAADFIEEVPSDPTTPRTEFVVPPKRFPDEVQTATDPPLEEVVRDSPARAVPYVGEFTQEGAFTRQPSRSGDVIDRSQTEGRQAPSPDTPGTRD